MKNVVPDVLLMTGKIHHKKNKQNSLTLLFILLLDFGLSQSTKILRTSISYLRFLRKRVLVYFLLMTSPLTDHIMTASWVITLSIPLSSFTLSFFNSLYGSLDLGFI